MKEKKLKKNDNKSRKRKSLNNINLRAMLKFVKIISWIFLFVSMFYLLVSKSKNIIKRTLDKKNINLIDDIDLGVDEVKKNMPNSFTVGGMYVLGGILLKGTYSILTYLAQLPLKIILKIDKKLNNKNFTNIVTKLLVSKNRFELMNIQRKIDDYEKSMQLMCDYKKFLLEKGKRERNDKELLLQNCNHSLELINKENLIRIKKYCHLIEENLSDSAHIIKNVEKILILSTPELIIKHNVQKLFDGNEEQISQKLVDNVIAYKKKLCEKLIALPISIIRKLQSPIMQMAPRIIVTGEPGVGKSRYCEEIAKSLGLSFLKIDIANQSYNNIYGDQHPTVSSRDMNLGLIANHMYNNIKEKGVDTFVLILNDIDSVWKEGEEMMPRNYRNFLLNLLDEKSFFCEALDKMPINMQRVIIIATVNNKNFIKCHPGIASRFNNKIKIGELNFETKIAIVNKYVDGMMKKSPEYFKDVDLKKLFESLKALTNKNKEPGVRELKNEVNDLVNFVCTEAKNKKFDHLLAWKTYQKVYGKNACLDLKPNKEDCMKTKSKSTEGNRNIAENL